MAFKVLSNDDLIDLQNICNSNIFEYVSVYVDNLAFAVKDKKPMCKIWKQDMVSI